MMASILDSSILHKKNFTHSFWLNLMMTTILKTDIPHSAILYKKNFTHSFSLNLMMEAILNSAILDSSILHKKNLTHSFSVNLMMVAILNSAMLDSYTAILDSNTLLSSLRFTQKHSSSTLTLTGTNSIWFTWWWHPSWIQPFCTKLWLKLVQSDSNSFILTQLDDGSHLDLFHVGFRHCHLGFKHLVIFSQIHSKTLFLYSDPNLD